MKNTKMKQYNTKFSKIFTLIWCILLVTILAALPCFAETTDVWELNTKQSLSNIFYGTDSTIDPSKMTPEFIEWNATSTQGQTIIRFANTVNCYYNEQMTTCDGIRLYWAFVEIEGISKRTLVGAQTIKFNSGGGVQSGFTFYTRNIPEGTGSVSYVGKYVDIEFYDIPKISYVNGQDMGRATMENSALYYSANYILLGRYTPTLTDNTGVLRLKTQNPGTVGNFMSGFSTFIFDVFENILTIEWFGWYSIGAMLGVFFSITTVLIFLKIFAGG